MYVPIAFPCVTGIDATSTGKTMMAAIEAKKRVKRMIEEFFAVLSENLPFDYFIPPGHSQCVIHINLIQFKVRTGNGSEEWIPTT
jgi:hypothetical protein